MTQDKTSTWKCGDRVEAKWTGSVGFITGIYSEPADMVRVLWTNPSGTGKGCSDIPTDMLFNLTQWEQQMKPHVYIIESKKADEEWLPVFSFPGMRVLFQEYYAAKEAAETMMQFDGENRKAGTVVKQYRAARYEPAE